MRLFRSVVYPVIYTFSDYGERRHVGTRKTLMEVVASSFRRSKTVIYLAGKLNDFQEFRVAHVLHNETNLGPYFQIIKEQASALHHTLFILAVISVACVIFVDSDLYQL